MTVHYRCLKFNASGRFFWDYKAQKAYRSNKDSLRCRSLFILGKSVQGNKGYLVNKLTMCVAGAIKPEYCHRGSECRRYHGALPGNIMSGMPHESPLCLGTADERTRVENVNLLKPELKEAALAEFQRQDDLKEQK